MLNNKGFTFIESLFVISVVLIMSLIVMRFHSYQENDSLVIEQMKQNIYSAKMNAMVYKEKTSLIFSDSKLIIKSDHLNKSIHLKNTLLESGKFSYNKNGHINEGGHIDFKINNETYKIVFHLGSGYFEIK